MYKQYFDNAVGCNTLEVILDNGVDLYFQLDDNPVQHIWQKIIIDNLSKPVLCSFSNKPIEEYVKDINVVLTRLGEDVITSAESQQLNMLHAKFVRQDPPSNDWKEINRLIHRIEAASRNVIDLGYFLDFCIDTDVSIPLEDYHKLWMTTSAFNWGVLSLGYNTLGKSSLDVALDNDSPEEIARKINITTESVICFGLQPVSDKRLENQFWKYAKDKNIAIDMNTLGLGNHFLGKVIITDCFLDYHKTASDWYVPNHSCKLAWNRDVFSKASKIVSIRFHNSDLAYNTALEHTGILCLK